MQTGSLGMYNFIFFFFLMVGCYLFQFEGSLTGKGTTLGIIYLRISILVKYGNGKYAHFNVKNNCISVRCPVTNCICLVSVQSLTAKDR